MAVLRRVWSDVGQVCVLPFDFDNEQQDDSAHEYQGLVQFSTDGAKKAGCRRCRRHQKLDCASLAAARGGSTVREFHAGLITILHAETDHQR